MITWMYLPLFSYTGTDFNANLRSGILYGGRSGGLLIMNIKVLGAHHDESRSSRYLSLLVDNKLAIDAGSLSSGLSLPEQRQLKVILLTHQHYDHVRDVPCIAIVLYHSGKNLRIYTTSTVKEALKNHLVDGALFPRFLELPPEKPTIEFVLLKPEEIKK